VISLIDLDRADRSSPQWDEIMRFKDSYTAPRLLHTSADFSLMALAMEDGSVQVWRLPDGELLQTFPKAGDQVGTMEFSRDGGRLVIGYLGNSALIWDMVTGTPVGVPLHHDAGVIGIWMSPNGISVVTGSLDMTTRAWDLGSGIALTEPMHHSDTPVGAKFLDGGRRLVTTSFDGQARSWNLEGSEALSVPIDMPGEHIAAVSVGGKLYAKIVDSKTLKVLSLGTRISICPDIRHDSAIQLARFSKDGTRLSSFSERQVKLTSLKDGATITHQLESRGGERIWQMGPNGNCVITAAIGPRDKGLTGFMVTNFSAGNINSFRFKMKGTVTAVAIHDDGERLAISTNSGGWLSERSADGEYEHRQFDDLKYAISMDFNHDGTRLLCGRID
jgi:WD40 repeat protein